MKAGANESDIRLIKKMAEQGLSPAKISYELQIVESCVKSFMPDWKPPQPKKKDRQEEKE